MSNNQLNLTKDVEPEQKVIKLGKEIKIPKEHMRELLALYNEHNNDILNKNSPVLSGYEFWEKAKELLKLNNSKEYIIQPGKWFTIRIFEEKNSE